MPLIVLCNFSVPFGKVFYKDFVNFFDLIAGNAIYQIVAKLLSTRKIADSSLFTTVKEEKEKLQTTGDILSSLAYY